MLPNTASCPCGSEKSLEHCCLPIIKKTSLASSPEALMRSRFTAYANGFYQYVFDTYAQAARTKLDLTMLSEGSQDTQWIKLEVLSAWGEHTRGEVEFIAYYKIKKDFYAMHERSRFIIEDGEWRYLDGDMLNKNGKLNVSRNQTCLCGSMLKYKRCCGK